MLTRMIVLLPSGDATPHDMKMSDEPSYAELCARMNHIFRQQRPGALFERVGVLSADGKPVDMFVDEFGLNFNLPVNHLATVVYHRKSIAEGERMAVDGIIPGAPKIHGIACLFNRKVWF